MNAVGSETGSGLALLAIYSLGLGIPFILAALFTETLLSRMHHLRRVGRPIQIIAGVVMILMGLAMITAYMSAFAHWMLRTFRVLGQIGQNADLSELEAALTTNTRANAKKWGKRVKWLILPCTIVRQTDILSDYLVDASTYRRCMFPSLIPARTPQAPTSRSSLQLALSEASCFSSACRAVICDRT